MSGFTRRELVEVNLSPCGAYRVTYSFERLLVSPGATEAIARLLGDPDPKPVKAKTFDEWISETSALLEECAKSKR